MTVNEDQQKTLQRWEEAVGELLLKNLLVENAINEVIGQALGLDFHSAGLVLQRISSYSIRIDLLKDLVVAAEHLNDEERQGVFDFLGRAKKINKMRNLVAHNMATSAFNQDEILLDKKTYKADFPMSEIKVVRIDEVKELVNDCDHLVSKI